MSAIAQSKPTLASVSSSFSKWDLIKTMFGQIGEDRVMLIAAGVTYYTLLALVPALAVLVSLYGLFSDPASVNNQVNLLSGVLPSGGLDIIRDQLTRLTAANNHSLGWTLVVSLVVSLWSAGAGIRSLIDSMNVAYDLEEKRSFIKINLLALAFTLGALVMALVFIAVVLVIPPVMHFLYLGDAGWLVPVVSYVLMLVLMLLALDVLYCWGPDRHPPSWKWITPGAVLAVIGVAVVSVLFSWYAANFSNYNATYGSLGALVGLLTWIWLSVTIVIIGAELNCEIETRARERGATDAGGKGKQGQGKEAKAKR